VPITPERKSPVQFDVDKIFLRAGGGAKHLVALLAKHLDDSPSLATVQMWQSRRAIPTSWLAGVLYALMREQVRIFDLMVRVPKQP
jgi:hypothetical protein